MSDPFQHAPRSAFSLADWIADIRVAWSFLTRFAFPTQPEFDQQAETIEDSGEVLAEQPAPNLTRALRAFPLIGIAIGLLSAIVYAVAYHLSVPPFAAALCALAASALLTGALHEDGLADFADGLAGGRSPEDRLRIMADSRIGAAGALALLFGIGLKTAAMAALATPGVVAAALVAAATASRAVFPLVVTRLPNLRPEGLGAMAGTPTSEVTWTAVGLGVVVSIVFLGIGDGIVAILVASLAAAAAAVLALRSMGGYTGDTLGAIQQVTETAILLAVAATHGVS